MTVVSQSAAERRQKIRDHAASIGIDECYLATMKKFWSSVALSTGHYSGQPVPKHKAIPNIEERHFALWLGLFEKTLEETAAKPDAVEYFMERANRIAESLKLAIFGYSGLPGGPQ